MWYVRGTAEAAAVAAFEKGFGMTENADDVRFWFGLATHSLSLCVRVHVRVHVRVRASVFVCVCVSLWVAPRGGGLLRRAPRGRRGKLVVPRRTE